jgi:hypothetical protein
MNAGDACAFVSEPMEWSTSDGAQSTASGLPYSVEPANPEKENGAADFSPAEPAEDIQLSLVNLDRWGCVTLARTFDNAVFHSHVNATVLGAAFIKACSSPR